MCGNNNLKSLAPNFVGKLHSNLLCHFRRYIRFLKTEITVICLNTLCLSVLLLDRYKLVTSNRHITVDTFHIKLLLCFFFVLCISKNISKCLILFRCIFSLNFCRSFFGIGCIINHLSESCCYRPQFCYCHFIPLLSGRR